MQVAFGNQFIFSVNSLLFDEVQLQSSQRYAKQERLRQRPVLQNLGPDTDTASLPGVLFVGWLGDPKSLEALHALKEQGEPQQLWTVVQGVGVPYLLGRWVIESIAETRSELGKAGQAHKIEWTLNLLRYD